MRWGAVILASSVLLLAAPAFAGDQAAAEALFRDGRQLASQGHYTEACAKLEESQRIDPGIGTLYHVADCHEHLGKIASAWGEFLDTAAQAKQKGEKDREAAARKRANALQARLPHLLLEGTPPNGATVKRDQASVGNAELGTAIPIDPGSHTIKVELADHVPWETTVTAIEGGTVRVTLPKLLTENRPSVAATAPMALTPVSTTTTTSAIEPAPMQPLPHYDVQREPSTTQRNAGIVIAGAGVVSLGVGSYFGIRAIDRRNAAKSHCDGNVCDSEGFSMRGDAITSGNVATITLISGAAALVGGSILFFTSPSSTEHDARSDLGSTKKTGIFTPVPYFTTSGGGLSVSGAFQ